MFNRFKKSKEDTSTWADERIEKKAKPTRRQFRIKVRLFDGHGAGQVEKFHIFVKPEHDVMKKTRLKIEGLFRQ